MNYIDLTHTFASNTPIYPGDPLPELIQIASIEKDRFVNHQIKMSMHVGTHMDAPLHMIAGGKKVSDFGPEKFFGQGHLVDARGKSSVGPELLIGLKIKKGDMVLVLTGHNKNYLDASYFEGYPEVSEEFAKDIIACGVSILGLDTPSPDKDPFNVHKMLLRKEILIVENLTNLEKLMYGKFEVAALPMKLETDAAPCRVVARISSSF